MDNHLIIGLGGTGGKVVAAYRRLIFEKYRGDLRPEGLWVDYLYLIRAKRIFMNGAASGTLWAAA